MSTISGNETTSAPSRLKKLWKLTFVSVLAVHESIVGHCTIVKFFIVGFMNSFGWISTDFTSG